MIDTALVAGCANLINLLDLRPGRAAKAAVLAAVPLLVTGGAPAAAAAAGASCALLPADLREEVMIGDCGANVLGGLLGLAVVRGFRRPARAVVLVAVTALTLASERISFSAVIEQVPALRRIDQLGRLPAE